MTPLAYTLMDFNLNLGVCSIFITYLCVTVNFFMGVVKYCESPLLLTSISTWFVVVELDTGGG